MMNLSHLFKAPLHRVKTKAVVFLLVVALLGFADAAYLTVEHYQNRIPPCSLTGGCENVLTSAYSMILGIPVSILGVIYYFLVLIGIFAYLESKNTALFRASLLFTIAGFVFSMWFIYAQVFIIHSYCLYCLGSALTSTILFVTAMEILGRHDELTN